MQLEPMRVSSNYINASALLNNYVAQGRHDEQMLIDIEGCLDAPNLLPAGSVVPAKFGFDEDEYIEVPSITYRG